MNANESSNARPNEDVNPPGDYFVPLFFEMSVINQI